MKRNAFTLIEMLVVMAILCILMTVAMSVTMKGADKAKETREISDTRQQNLITYMDSADSDYENIPQHLKEGKFGEKQ